MAFCEFQNIELGLVNSKQHNNYCCQTGDFTHFILICIPDMDSILRDLGLPQLTEIFSANSVSYTLNIQYMYVLMLYPCHTITFSLWRSYHDQDKLLKAHQLYVCLHSMRMCFSHKWVECQFTQTLLYLVPITYCQIMTLDSIKAQLFVYKMYS